MGNCNYLKYVKMQLSKLNIFSQKNLRIDIGHKWKIMIKILTKAHYGKKFCQWAWDRISNRFNKMKVTYNKVWNILIKDFDLKGDYILEYNQFQSYMSNNNIEIKL